MLPAYRVPCIQCRRSLQVRQFPIFYLWRLDGFRLAISFQGRKELVKSVNSSEPDSDMEETGKLTKRRIHHFGIN